MGIVHTTPAVTGSVPTTPGCEHPQAGTTVHRVYPDSNTKAIILARGDTQWQVAGSCSAHGPHAAGPDCVTHCCAAGPSSGCGGDAAGPDFDSDCFSAYAGPGPDCDYRWKALLSLLQGKPTSSGL